MDTPRSALRSTLAGLSLVIALIAIALSLLTLAVPAPARSVPAPVAIDLSLLITGRGAIGGPAQSHLFDPQMLVVRRGDTVRLRVMNQSFFRHGIEIAGYGVRTGELTGGPQGSELVTFTADKPGIFEYRCYLPHDPATATCAPDHDRMVGHLVVIDGGSGR
jgi:plastocyanin